MNGTEFSITVDETALDELGMEYMLVGEDVTSLSSAGSNFSEDFEVF
jgi:hypothetical protein